MTKLRKSKNPLIKKYEGKCKNTNKYHKLVNVLEFPTTEIPS